MSDTCKGCGAPIEWAKTVAGKAIPMEPSPMLNGNLVINADGLVEYVKADPNVERRMTHYALCQKAKDFRKAEKEAGKNK